MLKMKIRVLGMSVLALVLGLSISSFVNVHQTQAAEQKDISQEVEQEDVVQEAEQKDISQEAEQEDIAQGAEETITEDDSELKDGDIAEVSTGTALKVKVASQLQVMKGKSKKIPVKNAKTSDFVWKSSKTDVAIVSKNGNVKGISAGRATITAKNGKKTYKCVVKVYASKRHLSEWVLKNGRYYYYNQYGEKVTGKITIGNQICYFDSKGRQRVGWIEEAGEYYYYQIGRAGRGHMLTNQTVNGIRLKKNGAARVTKKNADKLRLFVCACESVFDETDWTMTRTQALRTMFVKLARDEIITYKTIGHFRDISQWDVYYANQYFTTGYGDCYTYASAMAYFAVALGYEDVSVCSSGGHGWCRIDGLYYDPRFANWGTSNMMDAFAVPDDLCGKGGRMNWKRWSLYTCRVDG